MNLWAKMKDYLDRAAWAMEAQPTDFLEARVARLERQIVNLSGAAKDRDAPETTNREK